MKRQVKFKQETWPLLKPFVIARGERKETHVVTLQIKENGVIARGEATPNTRYGETPQSVIQQLQQITPLLAAGLNRTELQQVLPAGSARNAVDAALWDLEAKLYGKGVDQLSALPWPEKIMTVQTISILSPEEMARDAKELDGFPIIKVKLDANLILERVSAVHENAPDAKLLIDANESWTIDILKRVAPLLGNLGVIFIEQPLPAGQDQMLASYSCPLPLGADESCHTRADLNKLVGKYDVINIKLDKTGGLTEAIALMEEAKKLDLEIMVGCMLSSSLGIAPAMFLASQAKYVDLDAPALLKQDQAHNLTIRNGEMSPLNPRLWGGTFNY